MPTNNTILLKKSSVSSNAPTALEYGEIAINYADGDIYYKNSDTTIKKINASDADTLDGLDSTQFLRSDTSDTMAGDLHQDDNYRHYFGTSDDASIYFDGSDLRVTSTGDILLNGQAYYIEQIGTAMIGGLKTGNARGTYALDIQNYQSAATKVASGDYSIAVGYDNESSAPGGNTYGYQNVASAVGAIANGSVNSVSVTYSAAYGNQNTISGSGAYALAVGYSNAASGQYSTAIGYDNTATNTRSTAIGALCNCTGFNSTAVGRSCTAGAGGQSSAVGYNCLASGAYCTAFGYQTTSTGNYATAFGSLAKTTINNSTELGYWTSSSSRGGVVRINGNGQVASTIVNSGIGPTDGGSSAGAEADGTLPRYMYAIQRNSTHFYLYYNDNGTMRVIDIGDWNGHKYWYDNEYAYFGTAQDAGIWYDGTDLNIDPNLVGSGDLNILGDIVIDNGTNTTLTVLSDDGGRSLIKAHGNSQGTGAIEVGQSDQYGGGISYNGDGTPAFVGGESNDHITFYRMATGTRTAVFHYPYNTNTVYFNGDVQISGDVQINGTNILENTVTTTSTTANQTLATASGDGGKFLLKGKDNVTGAIHITEINFVNNGSTVYYNEFGTVYSSAALGTFDVIYSGGLAYLRGTPASSNSTEWTTLVTYY